LPPNYLIRRFAFLEMNFLMVKSMKILLRSVASILLVTMGVQAESLPVRYSVLHSDERSILLEYRPQYLPVRTIVDGGREFRQMDFVGSLSSSSIRPGDPDLRYELIPLGFPSVAGNAVQVVASDYEDVPNFQLAPVPATRLRNDLVELAGYTPDQEKYSRSDFQPASVTQLQGPEQSRSMILGGVQIFPVQFSPASRTLRKYTRIVIEVTFGAPAGRRVQNKDDQPFEGYLANYAVARNWKFDAAGPLGKTAAVSSVLATGEWFRMSVTEEGMYILNASYLRSAGVNLSALDPRTIKIYGNGGRELPEAAATARPVDLVENAIYVSGENDGRFDDGDYVLFFAKSVRGTTYDMALHRLKHYLHHYAEANYYWLTFGNGNGKRMTVQQSLSDPPAATPSTFTDMIAIEDETSNLYNSGKDWLGRSYVNGGSYTYVSVLPGLASEGTITYRFRLVADSDLNSLFTVSQSGTTLSSYTLYGTPSGAGGSYASDWETSVSGTAALANNTSRLGFSFQTGSASGVGWNDWIEIHFPRRFEAENGNYLRFRSAETTIGVTEYALTSFASQPEIFNVTKPDSVVRIGGVTGSYSFRAPEAAGAISEYCAATSGAYRQPAGITRADNQNLRGDSTVCNFIIITSPEFAASANRLREYREQPEHGNLRTIVVDVNKIYNEFSGGVADVTAIRDYLKQTYSNRPVAGRPEIVLFLGQASYDYKGSPRTSYVPTWQTENSLDDVSSYSTDDFMVMFNYPSTVPFLATGRINARSVSEADAFISKVIGYESNSDKDLWKMRLLYIGDDGWSADNGGDEGTLHSGQAEDLAQHYTPEIFEKRKIYIAEYPTVQSAQGRRKPGAYDDIISTLNEGVLLINYTGHGNPTLWAHENIFNVQTSVPELVNANRLSLFFAATCNFSQFDDLHRESGSEIVLNKSNGGAIAAISATRKVYSFENADFNKRVFISLFSPSSGWTRRPGEAMRMAKAAGGNASNDQKFCLLGDPSMFLQFPSGLVSIDSINHQPATGSAAQIKALAHVTISGTVRNQSNQVDSSFAGRVILTTNDASRLITILNFSPTVPSWTYVGAGGTVYRGQSSIVNGRFTANFVVPKDISYADSTANGRLVAYSIASNSTAEGAGYTGNIHVGGTEQAPPDTAGPGMNIYLGSRSFMTGDVVGEDPLLIVDLADSNGINTSVSGIGHRIEAWVNGSAQSKDITESYTSDLDNFQKGTAQFTLAGLPQGRNTVRVRAWDTYNNATMKETFFDVTSTDQLRVTEMFNFPNPFAHATTFTFKQNLATPLSVTIKIYTLAGRLIQTLDASSSGEPFVKIPWDGRDRDGDLLANGVYLYKTIVRTTDGRFGSEVLGKLSVLK
jgi:hypothetical protein